MSLVKASTGINEGFPAYFDSGKPDYWSITPTTEETVQWFITAHIGEKAFFLAQEPFASREEAETVIEQKISQADLG